jgi:hypothetical protein
MPDKTNHLLRLLLFWELNRTFKKVGDGPNLYENLKWWYVEYGAAIEKITQASTAQALATKTRNKERKQSKERTENKDQLSDNDDIKVSKKDAVKNGPKHYRHCVFNMHLGFLLDRPHIVHDQQYSIFFSSTDTAGCNYGTDKKNEFLVERFKAGMRFKQCDDPVAMLRASLSMNLVPPAVEVFDGYLGINKHTKKKDPDRSGDVMKLVTAMVSEKLFEKTPTARSTGYTSDPYQVMDNWKEIKYEYEQVQELSFI